MVNPTYQGYGCSHSQSLNEILIDLGRRGKRRQPPPHHHWCLLYKLICTAALGPPTHMRQELCQHDPCTGIVQAFRRFQEFDRLLNLPTAVDLLQSMHMSDRDHRMPPNVRGPAAEL